ncbi:hypothetical protein OG921_00815 [Aldersonia sp. NBC_00410]|uniref:DUF6918 family protein n=1 Tax=Aldersonia sp. NBC_00410 TaxID=2975954 RepID=UPI00225A9BAA|nr:hypothetical protein [Aldersonia sp. NBC_00410]MCX5041731.1 hypothetical protein [Aldersonia sp. NBC_00410]
MVAVTTLYDALLVTRHPAFVKDAVAVIDAEVAGKRGAAGLAVKAGYGAVNRMNPDLVSDALVALLPELVGRLERHWYDYRVSGTGTFGEFLVERADDVAEELLEVTDGRVAASTMQAVKRVYATMRPAAKRHVIDALPRVGHVIERHAG